ncbi:MAG: hypothetical protein V8S33_11915 [Intestinibacter bartlettii]
MIIIMVTTEIPVVAIIKIIPIQEKMRETNPGGITDTNNATETLQPEE